MKGSMNNPLKKKQIKIVLGAEDLQRAPVVSLIRSVFMFMEYATLPYLGNLKYIARSL